MRQKMSGVRINTWNDDVMKVDGVISNNGRFVAGATARYNPKLDWTPSRRTAGTDTRILMRIDATISHVDEDGKQGDDLFDYISCRVMQIRGSFGQRIRVMTPFDNEANRQFKNLSISADMYDALKDALKMSITDAQKRAERGEGAPTSANSEFIEDSATFIGLAEKVAQTMASQSGISGQQKESLETTAETAAAAAEALGGSSN